MFYVLKRHPFPVKALLRRALVLTYALPSEVLRPLVAPGLVLDAYGPYGLVGIGMVETTELRPAWMPARWGREFFLSGYRIFVRFGANASALRGMQILRSDTDRRSMLVLGNLFTHYKYRLCHAHVSEVGNELEWTIRTPGKEADLEVRITVTGEPAALPVGSPFPDHKTARRFAGPLPYTFDYECQTHSMIRVQGVRQHWAPHPVSAKVIENRFLDGAPFLGAQPVLANAFYVHDVPYEWRRGERTCMGTR